MANIITKVYFRNGELTLPIDGINSKTDAEINFFITEHEPIILKKVLGYVLYKAFITGLAVAPTPLTKWLDLRDGGKEYEYNGVKNEYLGIKQIIADYVFAQIIDDKSTYITSSGGARQTDSENSLSADPTTKYNFAINDINSRQKTLDGFILSSNETDPLTYENYEPTLQERINYLGI